MADSEHPVKKTLTPLPVLVVSSRQEDHELFRVFLSEPRYSLHHASTLADAVASLQECTIPVVVTERTLPDGCWVDAHFNADSLLNPPLVIVFSDPEDASSWAHAFNVGAFDVLYRPLVEKIVEASVSLAQVRWSRRADLGRARAENCMLPARRKIGAGPRRGGARKAKAHATGAV